MPYNYCRAQKVLIDLMITYSPEALQDLLATGIDFPSLGLYKIEAEHLVPSLDNLIIILEERCFTRFNIPGSP